MDRRDSTNEFPQVNTRASFIMNISKLCPCKWPLMCTRLICTRKKLKVLCMVLPIIIITHFVDVAIFNEKNHFTETETKKTVNADLHLKMDEIVTKSALQKHIVENVHINTSSLPQTSTARKETAELVTNGSRSMKIIPLHFKKPHIFNDLRTHAELSLGATLLFTWCENKMFRFEHYVAVAGAMHIIQPRLLVFQYKDKEPMTDLYHHWITELLQQFPMFSVTKNPNMQCNGPAPSYNWIVDELKSFGGGLYLNNNIILGEQFIKFITALKTIITSQNVPIVYVTHAQVPQLAIVPHSKHSIQSIKTIQGNICETFSLNSTKRESPCYIVDEQLFPVDILTCKEYGCNLLRTYVYGESGIPIPEQSKERLAPNVVHYVWFGKVKPMSLSFFLSILSFIHIQKVEKICIHGDEPYGEFWDILLRKYRFESAIIEVLYRPLPVYIFGQYIQKVAHTADVVKADISYRYGGIISDVDFLMYKPFDEHFREYEFVVGVDAGKHGDFPDILNVGITISKAGNNFARMWLKSTTIFYDDHWLWNAGLVTYKIYEHNPRDVLINRYLQCLCYKYRFFPTWIKNKAIYQNIDDDSNQGIGFSITKRSEIMPYGFHFTWPDVYTTIQDLGLQQGVVGDLGRLILDKAGLLHLIKGNNSN